MVVFLSGYKPLFWFLRESLHLLKHEFLECTEIARMHFEDFFKKTLIIMGLLHDFKQDK